jgi:hypothetical protein
MDRFLSRTAFLLFAGGLAGCVPSNDAIDIRVQESRDTEAYGKYRNALARSNTELEKAGQAPVPILERDEWVRAEAAKKAPDPGK